MTESRQRQPEVDLSGDESDCQEAAVPQGAAPRSTLRFVWRIIWRTLVGVVGSAVILAGIGISLPGIPGPGFLVILAGLALLATEFSTPRRLLRYLREKVRRRKPPVGGSPS